MKAEPFKCPRCKRYHPRGTAKNPNNKDEYVCTRCTNYFIHGDRDPMLPDEDKRIIVVGRDI